MSRVRLRICGKNHTTPPPPGSNNITMGMNIQPSSYWYGNQVDNDLTKMGVDTYPDAGLISKPSGAILTATHLNNQGQVLSLPAGDTEWWMSCQSPEHACDVVFTWTPANATTGLTYHNCTLKSGPDLVAGTVTVTPTYSMDDVRAGAINTGNLGFAVAFTVGPGAPMTVTAFPVGQSVGATANFTAQSNKMTEAGGILRHMKRGGAENNQGYWNYGQSATCVTFPTTHLLTAAGRNTLASPDWQTGGGQSTFEVDSWSLRTNDGEPFEAIIGRCNTLNRKAWISVGWNYADDYLQALADVACSMANDTVWVELSNEVWNTGYNVHNQAMNEAYNRLNYATSGQTPGSSSPHTPSNLIAPPYDTSVVVLHDNVTGQDIYSNHDGWNERYCEKVIQMSKVIKARCTANGKPNAIKVVACFQNSSGALVAALLDYIPNNMGTPTVDGTALKANVDAVSSAPYFQQITVPTNVPPSSMAVLAEDLKSSIDQVTDIASDIAAAAQARGLPYMTYEGGDSVIFHDGSNNELHFSTGDTVTPVSAQVARNSIMYDCYMYWMDRLNHKLPAGSIVVKYSNCSPTSGGGSWGSIELCSDMEQTSSWLKANRPKAAAIIDWCAGIVGLQPALVGTAFSATGVAVGTIIGSLKRRTYGSTVTLTCTPSGAMSFVDPTAAVLQLQVADASAFASAGSISWSVLETHPKAASSVTTTGSVPVISTPIWDGGKSSHWYSISNLAVTATLQGNQGVDTLAIANKAGTSLDKWFDVTIDVKTAGICIGFCAPTSPSSGSQPGVCYASNTAGTNAFILWESNLIAGGLTTFGAGDKVRVRIKNNNVFYCAKWNGSAWVWQNGADPSANTGGYTVSDMDNTWLPCVDLISIGDQVTADFSGWA